MMPLSIVQQFGRLQHNYYRFVHRLVYSYLPDLPDETSNPLAVSGEQCLWILKWVDYSHKYGFGFQLSNDIYGASFNDGLSITATGDTRYNKTMELYYIDPQLRHISVMMIRSRQLLLNYQCMIVVMLVYMTQMVMLQNVQPAIFLHNTLTSTR